MLAEDREKALAKRAVSNMERLTVGTRELPPLSVGDSVLVQNQIGNHPSKWDITGVVVEIKEFDQYVLKIDGSGRLTLRNRKFLRKITPYQLTKHFKSSVPLTPSQESPQPTAHQPQAEVPEEIRPPVHDPEETTTPVTGPTSEPPETPTETPLAASPSPSPQAEPRRSTRVKKETDRLVDKMRFGGKTYDDTSTSSIDHSLRHCCPSGGGGITEHAPVRTGEMQQSSTQFKPWRPIPF